MKTYHKVLIIAGVIVLTSLSLKAKWLSVWSEKGFNDESVRVVSPNGDIISVACSADGKTVFVACRTVWTKGPDGATRGKTIKNALFKSTDGGDTWTVLMGD